MSAPKRVSRVVDDVDGFFVHTTDRAPVFRPISRARALSATAPHEQTRMLSAYGRGRGARQRFAKGRHAVVPPCRRFRGLFELGTRVVHRDYGVPDAVKVIPPGITSTIRAG